MNDAHDTVLFTQSLYGEFTVCDDPAYPQRAIVTFEGCPILFRHSIRDSYKSFHVKNERPDVWTAVCQSNGYRDADVDELMVGILFEDFLDEVRRRTASDE